MNTFRSIELFLPDIRMLLEGRRFDELKRLMMEINSIDLAGGLAQFPVDKAALMLKLLPHSKMIDIFEDLPPDYQQKLIPLLNDSAVGSLVEGIAPEATAKLIRKLPDKIVRRMTTLMERSTQETVCALLNYPEKTVGAIMQSDVIIISPDQSANAALQAVQERARSHNIQNIGLIFVCDSAQRLVGGLSLVSLVAAPPGIKVRDIMDPMSLIKVLDHADQEEAAKVFSKYGIDVAPVVDKDNRLVGLLKADNIIDYIQRKNTQDMQKLAGVEVLEDPYFKTPFLKMVKKRATWLCVLFLGEMLTATAMAFFEHEIAKAVVLALFIPLIISSGGNSGSQAATLIVRGMALKEITFGDWWRVMRREFFSGLVLGAILGSIGYFRISLWSQFSPIYGPHYHLVALTVGVALLLIVLWGSLAGSLLPILLRKIGLDPAVVSAPFVATLVDVTGLLIYFSIALVLLQGTLL